MSNDKRLTDPGAGLPREQAKAERLKAWKRPKQKAERERLRSERIAAVGGGAEHGDSVPNKSPR